jgi:hypothetical protein
MTGCSKHARTGGIDGAALAALLAALAGPAPVLRHHRDPARPPRHPLHRQAAQLTRYSICRQNLGIRLFPREWRFGGWELGTGPYRVVALEFCRKRRWPVPWGSSLGDSVLLAERVAALRLCGVDFFLFSILPPSRF